MNCPLCNSWWYQELYEFSYKQPDKYERSIGIYDVDRQWVKCSQCGAKYQIRNYLLKHLEKIYQKVYRSKKFRGQSIEETFTQVVTSPTENDDRFFWFGKNLKFDDSKSVLDIGSGFGIWPYSLKRAGYDIECVEENEDSLNFLYEKLGIMTYKKFPSKKYDVVTLIHVLEHIEKPQKFLESIKPLIKKTGHIFIEVPDAAEFYYLNPDHDEFNSCHVTFFDPANLCKLVDSMFVVKHMSRVHYKERNLKRIYCIASNQP